jgi:hypothetical protein
MLAGRSLEAFLNEKRSQEAKNRVRKSKTIAENTPKQIYDFAIFELSIRAFDTQSGWRDAYERHEERSLHGKAQSGEVQSKTARHKQVLGLHTH